MRVLAFKVWFVLTGHRIEAKLHLIPGICGNGEQTEFVPIILENFILERRLSVVFTNIFARDPQIVKCFSVLPPAQAQAHSGVHSGLAGTEAKVKTSQISSSLDVSQQMDARSSWALTRMAAFLPLC